MKGIITIMCMCIIPMIGITQSNINIYSNFNYTKIEKDPRAHNKWTVLSSKYETNRFTLDIDRVTWIGKTKTKTYTITKYWVFEGKPTYTVNDSKGEILVFQIIPNESIQLLWLDKYSRRMAIVFDILD